MLAPTLAVVVILVAWELAVRVFHVEAWMPEAIAVRDSKNPHGAALIFPAAEWDAFVGGAKDGEFDL